MIAAVACGMMRIVRATPKPTAATTTRATMSCSTVMRDAPKWTCPDFVNDIWFVRSAVDAI